MNVIFTVLLSLYLFSVEARDVIISVGGGNGTSVFSPQTANASSGDVVVFQFDNGTHGVVQSDFATPCIPISITNTSINGFNSGPRPAANPPTELRVGIDASNNATPIFFFDSTNGSCGMGAVGGINLNESSPENIDAFVRNAERLNGTQASTTSSTNGSSNSSGSSGPSNTQQSPSTSSTAATTSQASRIFVATVLSFTLVVIALSISIVY